MFHHIINTIGHMLLQTIISVICVVVAWTCVSWRWRKRSIVVLDVFMFFCACVFACCNTVFAMFGISSVLSMLLLFVVLFVFVMVAVSSDFRKLALKKLRGAA